MAEQQARAAIAAQGQEGGDDGNTVNLALRAFALSLAVMVMGWLSVGLPGLGGVAIVWPANGVVVALILRAEGRKRVLWLASGFAGVVVMGLAQGGDALTSAGFGLCNILEVGLSAMIVRRFVAGPLDLAQPRHVMVFGAAAFISSAVSAGIAGFMLGWSRGADGVQAATTWVLADGLGQLIAAPIVLSVTWASFRRLTEPSRRLGNFVALAVLILGVAIAFAQSQYQIQALVIAPMLLLVFRLEGLGAAIAVLLTAIMGVAVTLARHGMAHLADPLLSSQILYLQIFLLATVVICFPMAAVLAERRRTQELLQVSEARLRFLTDNSADIVIRFDRDHRILYVSPSCRRYGYEPEELLGRVSFDLLHPKDHARTRAASSALFAGRTPDRSANREQRIKTKTGGWVWMDVNPTLVRDERGEPVEIVSVLRDISERRAAADAVAASEAKFRQLAENATDIITRCDLNGVMTYLSPSAKRICGFEPEELIGFNALDLIHPDDARAVSKWTSAFVSAGARGVAERIQYRLMHKNGGVVWIEASPSLEFDPRTGKMIGLQDFLRDVTERKALEDELRRSQAEAEAATVAKSEFLANMSHEIRTPLTAIVGFANLLEGAEGLPPTVATYANRITRAGQTLLTVVNDVLDFSRIEAGQISLDPQPFDPARFVVETIDLIRAQAQEKGLKIATVGVDQLPPALKADSSRLRQVLLNLLTNAIKFTQAGGVTVTVDYLTSGAGVLEMSVSDTGVGIAPEAAERLFQRFSQADSSTSRNYGGTGLGLAICKSLTEMMGGDIGLRSQPGRGSTFWFNIAAPLCDAIQAYQPDHGAAAEPRQASVLVVDDVEMNRELVRTILSAVGYKISEAGGGAQAIEVARQTPFDMILMDLQMPGVDGIAATRAIRATSSRNQNTPILALSADVMTGRMDACLKAGMVDYIAKPITVSDLLSKMELWADAKIQSGIAAD